MEISLSPEVTRLDHLTLRRLIPDGRLGNYGGRSETRVVLVGNAYGVLPYVPRVADAMARRGYDIWWFAFSGQDNTPGTCTVDAAVRDLHNVIDHVRCADGERRRTVVLAHCAGGIVTTELFHRAGNPGVDRIILYGPLLNPARRRVKAEQRLIRAGVRYQFNDDLWHYPWLEKLRNVSVPTLFCHARDALNLDRANEQELSAAVRATPLAECCWFDEGYDVRFESIELFANRYASWFAQPGDATNSHLVTSSSPEMPR